MEARMPSGQLAAYQVIEYLRAFLFGRVAWDAIGALVIVSGAFGLFRRDVVDEVGGYWTDTVGEDLELTVRLHRHMRDSNRPYRITYAPDPVCWTEVPSDMVTLGRQRRRWHRGLWECLWRHKGMMLRRRYGAPGMIALPYFLTFEFCGPLMDARGLRPRGERLPQLPPRPRPRPHDVPGGVREHVVPPADRLLPARRRLRHRPPQAGLGRDAPHRLHRSLSAAPLAAQQHPSW
jgi:hypothetical protein